MPPNPDTLNTDAVHIHLGLLAPGFDVQIIPTCTSTNSVLMDNPPAEDGRIHVVATEIQTAGRGRRGRQWQSWPHASLAFSALWRFAPSAPVPAGLSLVAGVAVAHALERLDVQGVQLKWPNDVLINGDKLAGILVELSSGRDRSPAAVVGIGLNVRLPPNTSIPDQPHVTDLATHLPVTPGRNELLACLLTELHTLFATYASAGFPALRGAWQQRNAFANLPVQISSEGQEQSGICTGVDDDGALLLHTESGMTRILSGEVSLRPGT